MNKIKNTIDLKKRREAMKKSAGAWKGIDLGSNVLWKEVLMRKSYESGQ